MITYQTPDDVSSEAVIASHIETAWNCRLQKLRQFEVVDRALMPLHSDSIRAWVEIKCRKATSTQYPSIMISLHKFEAAVWRAEVTKLPFIFVPGFTDAILCYRYKSGDNIPIVWGGRTNRGMDNEDVEPVAMIPIELFKKVLSYEDESL